ncbi:MAG: TM2 domain-containing protein [Saprospiraceae bacterium]
MKKFLQLPLLIAICALMSVTSMQAAVELEQNSPMEQLLDGTQPGMTLEQFVQLTPKQIEEMTGQKMGFKETLALKKAQKQIKKDMKDGSASNPKSQIIALILVIVVGGLGVHRFYLGYTLIGVIQLLTAGGCGIWWLIDLIRIITGDLGPADGSSYDPAL